MNITIKNIKEAGCVCDALILPFTEGESGLYSNISPSVARLLSRLFSKEFYGRQNEMLLVPAPEDIAPGRLLLVGLGKRDQVSREKMRNTGGKAAAYLRDMGIKRIALSGRIIETLKLSPADFIEGALLGLYTFKKYLHNKEEKTIKNITVISRGSKELKDSLLWTETAANAVNFARDLINTPANDMTPSHLARVALSFRQKQLSVKILGKKDAGRFGMGAFLSVANGSNQPPKFIILHYNASKDAPIVLIGKSITFDSGGLSIKPAEGMEKMKYDMAGGASVLGVFKAVAQLGLPVNLVGILPATENVIGGSASKPGDVVRACNGKTIEIISTDAEGRMTLADAISYAARFKPRFIIDIATLTGACSIALGNGAIAMMGNDRYLIEKFMTSGHNTYERVWEMPLFEEYRDYIKSDIADLKNSGGKSGSLSSSGFFLYEFAGNAPWVHLDIAGTAWLEKDKPYMPRGASGVGVRLLLDLIKEMK
jgi:leucyl aminopeptidase